jgi:hypothetical protein
MIAKENIVKGLDKNFHNVGTKEHYCQTCKDWFGNKEQHRKYLEDKLKKEVSKNEQ